MRILTLFSILLLPINGQALDKSLECLAKNIYFESRGESFKAKVAVANVTLNRVKNKNFPNTICGVVYQPYQFSWTRNKNLKITDRKKWLESIRIAKLAISNRLPDVTKNSLFFHNKKVKPDWSRKLKFNIQIDNHKFYAYHPTPYPKTR